MELHEFVKETLVQIIKGVLAAQNSDDVQNSTAAIAPSGQQTMDSKTLNQTVEFDVAVTAKEQKATKGSASVSITILKLGTQGESSKGNSTENRIKFKVPIYLPSQKISHS